MNSFNDEVCEYNYSSVTENFDFDLDFDLDLDFQCVCTMDYDPVICDGEKYDNINCAIVCGKKNKDNCYKEKVELL